MGYIQGEGRSQGALFPVVLDDLIPIDHVCRVIDAFVDALKKAFGVEFVGVLSADVCPTKAAAGLESALARGKH